MRTLEPILRKHPFFEGLADDYLALITGCAKNVRFQEGEALAREGDIAEQFYVLREGRVSVELPAPNGGSIKIQTLVAGEIAGWSWLIPPNIWQFDLVAMTPIRALEMNGECLRKKCEDDTRLGYELMKRFSNIMSNRLAATRLQLIDLYGSAAPVAHQP